MSILEKEILARIKELYKDNFLASDSVKNYVEWLIWVVATILIIQDGMYFAFFFVVPYLVNQVMSHYNLTIKVSYDIGLRALLYIAAFYYFFSTNPLQWII